MVDDAHATGLLETPKSGAGIVMSTLSKALGSAGGFVAGSRDLVEWLRNRARSYVFDTAPAPAAVGAAIEALRIIAAEPERGAGVVAAAARLARALAGLGYDVTALDLSPEMLSRATRKAEARRLRLRTIIGPATGPPDGPFDAVVERHLLWTTPDPVAALAAWRSLGGAGVHLCIVSFFTKQFIGGLIAANRR